FPPSVPSRYRFTACILSFEENLAIKNAPPIVNYVSNNWGALHSCVVFYRSFSHFPLLLKELFITL
ncbi:hypothetical protein Q0N88_32465, partial [Bacillus thuringiensis]|uniref:hypothetical protein n=1 Tax=Bacillus thuringiensis TaxID=1428 RepID=UPI00345A9A58